MNGVDQISEADWKILRSMRPVALERYCERILGEVSNLAAGDVGTAEERYHALWDLLRNRDGMIADALDDHRRSNALPKIMNMRVGNMLTDDEYRRFSAATRDRVDRFLEP